MQEFDMEQVKKDMDNFIAEVPSFFKDDAVYVHAGLIMALVSSVVEAQYELIAAGMTHEDSELVQGQNGALNMFLYALDSLARKHGEELIQHEVANTDFDRGLQDLVIIDKISRLIKDKLEKLDDEEEE